MKKKTSETDPRRAVKIGPHMGEVSPVMYWYRHHHFANEDEAQGAFKLAYQQAMDGMGPSIHEWMGLTAGEYELWHRTDQLPAHRKKKR